MFSKSFEGRGREQDVTYNKLLTGKMVYEKLSNFYERKTNKVQLNNVYVTNLLHRWDIFDLRYWNIFNQKTNDLCVNNNVQAGLYKLLNILMYFFND